MPYGLDGLVHTHDRHDHTLSTLQCHMVLMVLCILRTAMITPSPRCSAQAQTSMIELLALLPPLLCARCIVRSRCCCLPRLLCAAGRRCLVGVARGHDDQVQGAPPKLLADGATIAGRTHPANSRVMCLPCTHSLAGAHGISFNCASCRVWWS